MANPSTAAGQPGGTTVVPPAPVILRVKDLAQRYLCDVRSITRYHSEGVIPPGRYLPKRHWPFWYLHEILENEQGQRRLKRRLDLGKPKPKQIFIPLQYPLPFKS